MNPSSVTGLSGAASAFPASSNHNSAAYTYTNNGNGSGGETAETTAEPRPLFCLEDLAIRRRPRNGPNGGRS